jgi:hypothetical protein
VHSGSDFSPGTAVLLVLIYGVGYFAPVSKGRPAVLGASLGALWLLVISSFDSEFRTDGSASASVGAAVVALILAVAFLAAGLLLDRRGLSGPATPFIAVGNWASFYAAITMGSGLVASLAIGGSDPAIVPALLIILVGLLLLFIGALTARRFTLWHGAFIVGAGVVATVGAMFESSSGLAGPVLVLLIAAAGLLAATPVVERWQTALADWITPRLEGGSSDPDAHR